MRTLLSTKKELVLSRRHLYLGAKNIKHSNKLPIVVECPDGILEKLLSNK